MCASVISVTKPGMCPLGERVLEVITAVGFGNKSDGVSDQHKPFK